MSSSKLILSRRVFPRLFQRTSVCSQHMPVRRHNFDGDTYAKTNLVMMTKEDDTHTFIEAFSPIGFRLTSGFRVLGPCALFPKSALHWNVRSSEMITPAALSLFCLLEPKLDILILGIGDRGSPYDKSIIKYLRSKRINVEILPTEQACSTFNFLNSERRVVAAALIPPKGLDCDEDNIISTDMDKDEMVPKLSEITKTMKSWNEKGIVKTISEGDRSRERSSPTFRHTDENKDSSDDKPR